MRGSIPVIVIVFLGMSSFYVPSSSAQESPVNLQRHWVMHEGRNIEVYGYRNTNGKIVWDPGLAENARPRERRDSPVELPGRLPKATIVTEPPKPAASDPMDWQTKGVMRPTSPAPAPRYTAESPEARRFIADVAEGPSDPAKLHVTIIGNADERARVTNDIKTDPAFEGLRDSLLVQDYDPKEWPVDPALGFRPGKPAIIVQASKGTHDLKGGRVIYRTEDYAVGAKGLAVAIRQAQRKADPNYDPNKDPGPEKPSPTPTPNPAPSLPDVGSLDSTTVIVIAVLVFALILPKKER